MKKRISALIACFLTLSLLLAGCGAGQMSGEKHNAADGYIMAPSEIAMDIGEASYRNEADFYTVSYSGKTETAAPSEQNTAADGRKRSAAHVSSDYNGVHRVVKLLEPGARKYRQKETKQLFCYGAACQIFDISRISHGHIIAFNAEIGNMCSMVVNNHISLIYFTVIYFQLKYVRNMTQVCIPEV